MMTALLVSVVLSGVDTLDQVRLGKLSFKAPIEWKKTAEENSLSWAAPGEEAQLAVSVFPVDPQRPAKACLDQLVPAVWPAVDGGAASLPERLPIATQPAAKRVSSDYVGEGEAAKSEENRVTTTTLVGCDGRTKWVLTYTAKTKSATRFGPILKRIIDSISYGK